MLISKKYLILKKREGFYVIIITKGYNLTIDLTINLTVNSTIDHVPTDLRKKNDKKERRLKSKKGEENKIPQ